MSVELERKCYTAWKSMSRIQKGMDPKKALLQGVNYL